MGLALCHTKVQAPDFSMATEAHDTEVTITNRRGKSLSFSESKKDKA